MKLPASYVTHLDHRITALMTFTVRREVGFFGPDHGESKQLGDIYRGSQEGAGIMLRILLEFLGVKAAVKKGDDLLGRGGLAHIAPVDLGKLDAK